MSSARKEGIIFISFILTIILLLSIYVSYIINIFKPYYKAEVNGVLLGYYLTTDEYYILYEQACVNTDEQYHINYFIDEEPTFTLVHIKQKAVNNTNNLQLIKNNLNKTYDIYELTIDTEDKIYLATEQQTDTIKNDIQKKIKTIKTEVKLLTVTDLSLLSTQEQIAELRSKYIRVSNVTSRSGRIDYRIAKKIVENNYEWPLEQTSISSYYGMRTMKGVTKSHTGVDIPCPLESDVKAVDSGAVIFADWSGGYGYYIQIDHGNGVVSAYAHLQSLNVKNGDSVTKGQIIAKSGSTGNSTGPHLHLEYIVNGSFCNPLTFYQGS
jgi:murein DD-endopeptidase MepM/ murein hydrolase activator NlpD